MQKAVSIDERRLYQPACADQPDSGNTPATPLGHGPLQASPSQSGQNLAQIRNTSDPLAFLHQSHSEQLRICDLLEEIADSLPLHVDRLKCFYAAAKLRTSVAIHQMDEDRGLFPLMRKHGALEDGVLSSLDRLESEHIDDESLSLDIIEALENLARGKDVQSIDGLSFMLRAFFDSHRRHIMFENEIILPLARKTLNSDHLAEFEQVILQNRTIEKADFFAPSPCASAKAAFIKKNNWSE